MIDNQVPNEIIDGENNEKPKAVETLFINEFTDGILDLQKEMFGPLKDGGTIIADTTPGCWGPIITPRIHVGHEVTKPVYIEGAEIGDAVRSGDFMGFMGLLRQDMMKR